MTITDKAKTQVKPKEEPDLPVAKYHSPFSPKQSIFSTVKFTGGFNKSQRFVNTSFRTQHKGGS